MTKVLPTTVGGALTDTRFLVFYISLIYIYFPFHPFFKLLAYTKCI